MDIFQGIMTFLALVFMVYTGYKLATMDKGVENLK